MQGNLFYGCGTALVTPFRGSRVDFDALENLIDWQIDEDIDALVILGTTGEPEDRHRRRARRRHRVRAGALRPPRAHDRRRRRQRHPAPPSAAPWKRRCSAQTRCSSSRPTITAPATWA